MISGKYIVKGEVDCGEKGIQVLICHIIKVRGFYICLIPSAAPLNRLVPIKAI